MECTEPRLIKKSRKAKRCQWCYELIEVGQPKYYWFTYGDNIGCDVHPECYEALCRSDYKDEMPAPGDNPRGCDCNYCKGCKCGWVEKKERCKL